MQTKLITAELRHALSAIKLEQIPMEFAYKAAKLGVKEIYTLREGTGWDKFGIYGNVILVLHNGQFVDIQTCPDSLEAILNILA